MKKPPQFFGEILLRAPTKPFLDYATFLLNERPGLSETIAIRGRGKGHDPVPAHLCRMWAPASRTVTAKYRCDVQVIGACLILILIGGGSGRGGGEEV